MPRPLSIVSRENQKAAKIRALRERAAKIREKKAA